MMACYRFLLVLLDEYDPDQNRLFSERDNFQSLCITLVSLCFDDRRRREKIYRKIVRDLCILGEENPLLTAEYFDWFQSVSERSLGKKTMHELLYRADAEDYVKTYARMLEEYQSARNSGWKNSRREEPQTAEELYQLLKAGKRPGREWALLLACGWMRRNKEQEVVRLAAYYKEEKDWDIRCQILRMLAKNYEVCDQEILTNAVKQIPITYWNAGWHGVFGDVRDMFSEPGKGKPNELLLYMYRNTLCSFCRERIVKQMGRRRMLTCELLKEMQYDCNEEIRKYARRKLPCMGLD